MKFPEKLWIRVPEDPWIVVQYQEETILESHHASDHTITTMNKAFAPSAAFFL